MKNNYVKKINDTNSVVFVKTKSDWGNIAVIKMCDIKNNNTFSDTFVKELIFALDNLKKTNFKAIILQGLPDIFSAGASQDMLLKLAEGEVNASDFILSEFIINFPVPIIAAMEGSALGGGLVIGLCCDIIILNQKRLYGANFINMGFTPGMGCTKLLQLAVGDYIANEMILGGRFIKGKTLIGKGNINYILPRDQIFKKAVHIAMDFEDKPLKILKLLKGTLSLKKKLLLAEARISEEHMHNISFNMPNALSNIKDNYGK